MLKRLLGRRGADRSVASAAEEAAAAARLDRLSVGDQGKIARIPDTDMIQARYDRVDAPTPTKLLLIFSTPRSGSTMLCDRLWALGYAHAHEYLQDSQYLQILAGRWPFLSRTREIDWQEFASALAAHRTSDNGVLGINVHGEHVGRLARLWPHLSGLETTAIRIHRRDRAAQALSFAEALQTENWSADFEPQGEARYDFNQTRRCIERIAWQEFRSDAFLNEVGLTARSLHYEDFVSDEAAHLADLTGLSAADVADMLAARQETGLKRQADPGARRRLAARFLGDAVTLS